VERTTGVFGGFAFDLARLAFVFRAAGRRGFSTRSGFGRDAWASVSPMRNRLVPQKRQLPWVPGVPVRVYTGWALTISRFVLHFTQYASVMISCFARDSDPGSLLEVD
jgi:hypothetical protein